MNTNWFLDNRTLVFKKWYNVEGQQEFFFPKNLNRSVVLRYTHSKGKTVLDRGFSGSKTS